MIDRKSTILRSLPATLINKWAKAEKQAPVWGEWLVGSLMHCDVTGFTAMNESLASMGHEGAEIMAKILNQFFERMLSIGESWNGIQMKFGGDAMLLYFPEQNHAQCAVNCGLEMQAAMKEFSKIHINNEICKLRMRIGVHSGRFFSASLGNDDGPLHYLLSGSDVNKAADVEPLAEPGQVVVSNETAQIVSTCSRLSKTKHAGIWKVKSVDPVEVKPLSSGLSETPDDLLSRYLIPSIADGSASNIQGEHRRATIAFIYLFGLSELLQEKGEDEALWRSNEYMKIVMSLAGKYSGSLLASDVAEHADKLVVVFGVPVSSDNQEESCLRFSFELNERLKKKGLGLRHQIGINTGFVFAGEIGSSWRREYTTIGDNMNLAARLMAAAGEGNILVSAATAKRAGDGFSFESLAPITVKGKSRPIEVLRLKDVSDEQETEINAGKTLFIGRKNELDKVMGQARQIHEEGSFSVFISGDPGIGKSGLCEKIIEQLQVGNWLTAYSVCQSYNSHNAFSAWKYPLIKLFGLLNSETENEIRSAVKAVLLRYCPEMAVFSPLVEDILAISQVSNAVVNSLDAKTKHEKRVETIVSLLVNMAKENPVCLVFDNANWMDSSSVQLINEIVERNLTNILTVFSSRTNELFAGLAQQKTSVNIDLQPFADQEAYEFVMSLCDLGEEFAQKVVKKTGGNPLFIKELILSGSSSKSRLPDTIYDVVMVKLDRLASAERDALRNASVIGQVFGLNTLGSICNHVSK